MSKLVPPKVISRSQTVLKHPYWTVSKQRWRWASGHEGPYYCVRSPGSVIVLPIQDGELALTWQYRIPNERFGLEAPGGAIEPGEDPLTAAKRELAEEAGLVAESWTQVGLFNPCKGLTDETCTVFVARNLHNDHSATPDPGEVLETRWVAKNRLGQAIASGELWDGMTLAALGIAGTNFDRLT